MTHVVLGARLCIGSVRMLCCLKTEIPVLPCDLVIKIDHFLYHSDR